MSLDQFDLGTVAVLAIYVGAYITLIVRRLQVPRPESEEADPFEGWG